jgi:hypothetical protein
VTPPITSVRGKANTCEVDDERDASYVEEEALSAGSYDVSG